MRQKVAQNYNELLAEINGVTTPVVPSNTSSVWAQYSLLAKNEEHRHHLQKELKNEGVPTAIYYPKPLHLQTAFAGLEYKEGDFPVSEDASIRIFSLPMHPYLEKEDQEKIAGIIRTVNA
jgi:UDP-2-acetamido-2-deoxy-ribo-hexuluronate aminotransferase